MDEFETALDMFLRKINIKTIRVLLYIYIYIYINVRVVGQREPSP
jgi:hypothetical protein